MIFLLILISIFNAFNYQFEMEFEKSFRFVFEDEIIFNINEQTLESIYSLEGEIIEKETGLTLKLESIKINDEIIMFENPIITTYKFIQFEKVEEEAVPEVEEEAVPEVEEEAVPEVEEEAVPEVEENKNIYPTRLVNDLNSEDLEKWLEPMNLIFSVFKNVDFALMEDERVFEQGFKSGFWKAIWIPTQESIEIDINGSINHSMYWPPVNLPIGPLLFFPDDVDYEFSGKIKIQKESTSNELFNSQLNTQKKIEAPWSESINGERKIKIKILQTSDEE